MDPIRAIAAIASENGMWHHADAAYAGSAMICPEFRELQDGVELVDSYTFNPHKWLLTILIVRFLGCGPFKINRYPKYFAAVSP